MSELIVRVTGDADELKKFMARMPGLGYRMDIVWGPALIERGQTETLCRLRKMNEGNRGLRLVHDVTARGFRARKIKENHRRVAGPAASLSTFLARDPEIDAAADPHWDP